MTGRIRLGAAMAVAGVLAGWSDTRLRVFRWRKELALPGRLALCAAMAGATGLAAQVRIPLGFTPVPVTGQVFAVLLSGVLLGGRFGALSQLIYVALGTAGVPWFSGWTSGALLGPTSGYLLGFVPAAALVGWLTDRCVRARGIPGQLLLMSAGVAVIYACGAVQFAAVTQSGPQATLACAVLPFIRFDLAKALAVAAVSTVLLPKQPYDSTSPERTAVRRPTSVPPRGDGPGSAGDP